MSYFVVEGDMGFCGTESFHTIEMGTAEEAEDIIHGELSGQISIEILGEFDTEEEADQFCEDEGI